MTPHMLAVGVQGRTAQLEGSEAQSQLTNSHSSGQVCSACRPRTKLEVRMSGDTRVPIPFSQFLLLLAGKQCPHCTGIRI